MTTDAVAPTSESAHPIRPLWDAMPPVTVLYDDLCEFCRWTASELRRWDRDHALRFTPFHDVPRDPLLRELLSGHDLADHVHVVDGAGRVAVGGEAILAIVGRLPGGAPVTRLFELSPPAAKALDLGYRVLNRQRGIVADTFRLNGPTLREPDGFDPATTDVGPDTILEEPAG
jgi:predicted DCC family thiol-disulfide oxidoreductase YuxK